MKTNQERIESISKKVQNKKSQRAIWISCLSAICVCVIVIGTCFGPSLGGELPGGGELPQYKNDDYYPLIAKINDYKDRFKPLSDGNVNEDMSRPDSPSATAPGEGETDNSGVASGGESNKYEETTLNQVNGVIEGDILKRSSKNVFYLSDSYYYDYADGKPVLSLMLDVYDINKSDTKLITAYYIKSDEKVAFSTYRYGICAGEMYLSDDASVLTVLVNCKALNGYSADYVCVITLNVSDLSNITEIGRTYVSGRYVSSRKTDGELLIVTDFSVNPQNVDYNDKSTFVPVCGKDVNSYLPIKNISVPEDVTDCEYTVLAKLDEKTQQVKAQYALFSYLSDVYVSQNNVYAFRTKYCCEGSDENYDIWRNPEHKTGELALKAVTEITQLSYKNGIEKIAQFCVDGYAKDQYSLDEKDGVLRVVTTLQRRGVYYSDNKSNAYYEIIYSSAYVSASLYCVDLDTQKVLGKVEKFAPAGETVRSVRFNGDTAYVCTAVRITDPVFAFDLSDYNNITVKDTGVITGFSVSLIPFGDVLLGIGTGNLNSLKIEAYTQTDSAVISAGVYEYNYCQYSTDYKAHFIDAEHQLVGLQIDQFNYVTEYPNKFPAPHYILLRYDSATQSFTEVAVFAFGSGDEYASSTSLARAFYCDNGVYVFNKAGCHSFIDLSAQ